MRHIRQIMQNETDVYTVVVVNENDILEQHQSIVDKPEIFEIVDCEIPEIHQRINYVGVQVPDELTLGKFMSYLALIGLEEQVLGAIEMIPDTQKKTLIKTYLKYGGYVQRNSEATKFVQIVLNKTDSEVDQFFINANNIEL